MVVVPTSAVAVALGTFAAKGGAVDAAAALVVASVATNFVPARAHVAVIAPAAVVVDAAVAVVFYVDVAGILDAAA